MSAFSHSPVFNWAVGIGIPQVTLTKKLWSSIFLLTVGALALLTMGSVFAKLIGDRITQSIYQLGPPAMALGHGDQAERLEQEMRLMKQRLEQSEALQCSIFEEAPDAILLVASSGLIVRANAQAQSMFGYTEEQFLRLTVENLMPEEVRHRHVPLRDAFLPRP